jgi:predicted amidophosphoribosyltransferase
MSIIQGVSSSVNRQIDYPLVRPDFFSAARCYGCDEPLTREARLLNSFCPVCDGTHLVVHCPSCYALVKNPGNRKGANAARLIAVVLRVTARIANQCPKFSGRAVRP